MYNVVGIEKVDYKNQNGNQVKGCKFHCVVETESPRVEGSLVETVYLSDRTINNFGRSPRVGDICNFLYNKYGNITHIEYIGE
jgi:hypothetical protein